VGKWFVYLFAVIMLAGCIGENYNVGHPITTFEINGDKVEIKPIHVEWQTQGDSTNFYIDKVQFEQSIESLSVVPNQMIKMTFADSINNKGEYTSVTIAVKATDVNQTETHLYEDYMETSTLTETHSFQAPAVPGEYMIDVYFEKGEDVATYRTKILVK